jgi:hypothetical protein
MSTGNTTIAIARIDQRTRTIRNAFTPACRLMIYAHARYHLNPDSFTTIEFPTRLHHIQFRLSSKPKAFTARAIMHFN